MEPHQYCTRDSKSPIGLFGLSFLHLRHLNPCSGSPTETLLQLLLPDHLHKATSCFLKVWNNVIGRTHSVISIDDWWISPTFNVQSSSTKDSISYNMHLILLERVEIKRLVSSLSPVCRLPVATEDPGPHLPAVALLSLPAFASDGQLPGPGHLRRRAKWKQISPSRLLTPVLGVKMFSKQA